ncbi:MAG: tryptophan--tRNA ligase [Anaerolineales bacterium]|nr:tryptophan--tRNA ligase [Anaerolineales bacterium]
MNKKRILTGDRPTGSLHLGHYIGSLQNRVKSQKTHDSFFIIADLHTLTTRPEKKYVVLLKEYIFQIVLDYLAVGIDPEKSTIFIQSSVPGISELNTLLGMLVSAPRLERIPSLKEMARAEGLDTMPFGLLGYPVLMAADILLPRADLVPVGTDNQGNVELARELASRFNHIYGEIFPIPEIELEDTLVGTDGQAKMSKSLNNAIYLSDSNAVVEEKVMRMYTDPNRISADVPGVVDDNPVFIYHNLFNQDQDEVLELKERYRLGKVGDVEVKQKLSKALHDFLDPIRQRRVEFERCPGIVDDILSEGTLRMQDEAQETLALVREAMGFPVFQASPAREEPVQQRAKAFGGLAFM